MRRIVGLVLVVVSSLSVVQTARLFYLFENGRAAFEERTLGDSPIMFARHAITVSDDQPHDSSGTYAEFDGRITLSIDGRAVGAPSRAEIRRGLRGFGRYHGWLQAWLFESRESGRSTLWIGRRIQESRESSPRFEITTVASDGRVEVDTLRAWRLGFDYRYFRTTQFITSGTWATIPLTLEIAVIPPLLLIFPLGTFVTGIFLLRHKSRITRKL